MSTELYFQIEVCSSSSSQNSRWWHFARVMLPQDYLIFALLAGVRADGFPAGQLECLAPKGLPADVAEATLQEDSLTVDDEAAALEVPNTCSRADAEEYVKSGLSRYLHNGYSVTHFDFHSHSWASLEELQGVLRRYQEAGGEWGNVVKSALAMMECLQGGGSRSRAVFWFLG